MNPLATDLGDPLSSSGRISATTGATYRQLDHWARVGWLRPLCGSPGSGSRREWPAGEIEVARVMARLVNGAGLPPALAVRVARGDTEIAPGVWVLVDMLGELVDRG